MKKIIGREVLDSRGCPTVECEITLADGRMASAIVPSGASTGSHEAIELRDGEKRFGGKGVLRAVKNINGPIAKKLIGMDASAQKEIDSALIDLDGTKNKGRLGANAILAVSLAAARANALFSGMELFKNIAKMSGRGNGKTFLMPVPFSNIINGGVHAGNDLKIQEFMVAPVGAKGFYEGARMVSEVYGKLKADLKEKYGKSAVNVGDEGGFAPPLKRTDEGLEMIQKAIDEVGYPKEVKLAIDAAASEFFKNGKYEIDGRKMAPEELSEYYSQLIRTYKIISLEDPFSEDEFGSFARLTKRIGGKVQIVADDLTVTNISRLKTAVLKKSANCLLLKVNQIGTLTESIVAANYAFKNGWGVMVSHRSGETEDAFIADLAVGLGCGQIKLGAPARGERTAKYNRLLRIEGMLGKDAEYG